MGKLRALGIAVAATAFVLAGTGMAAADEVGTGSATGSANFVDGLATLITTGSGGVKPLPTAGYTNPYLDGWSAGSSNLLTALGNLIGTGSAA
ncbi:hypothetical protein IU443_13500 [Nocardia farcinica]|uniref:Secreted protein n=1 Tax=Nocardia farcinica TaxID=37329 RepID=A0A0H5P193_NOCFR|nr:hypothetical protein [Nocardia farcinica]SLJ82629.1 Uncharacterised protein [Mycobacteroides abscessus subsp. abscessus]AXK87303.1 hypothetical protein DXT66_18225 [Nocardia farcinica]MBF6068971.1 hypothetical protein [Nocardia farcinica]MBF6265045.1 hypothetical protein [Nocardia farcinica]MBF6282905.1 hypothetical protein [Nocardia farcinica]